jgi:hypothetical protein
MALVEQLVLDCEHSRLKDILEFLKRNPFYEYIITSSKEAIIMLRSSTSTDSS